MDLWPPREIIGHHIDRDRSYKQKNADPEQPRMMNAPPVATNPGIGLASMTIFGAHLTSNFCLSVPATSKGGRGVMRFRRRPGHDQADDQDDDVRLNRGCPMG
jgi:hypothetical protein